MKKHLYTGAVAAFALGALLTIGSAARPHDDAATHALTTPPPAATQPQAERVEHACLRAADILRDLYSRGLVDAQLLQVPPDGELPNALSRVVDAGTTICKIDLTSKGVERIWQSHRNGFNADLPPTVVTEWRVPAHLYVFRKGNGALMAFYLLENARGGFNPSGIATLESMLRTIFDMRLSTRA